MGHSSFVALFVDCWCGAETVLQVAVELDISSVGEFLLLVFGGVLDGLFCSVGELLDEEYWFELPLNWTEGGEGVGFLLEKELQQIKFVSKSAPESDISFYYSKFAILDS